MVENQSESLPINGMKMTFPSDKNYALRFFELFDISKISPSKYHNVLEILENLLNNTNLFYLKKKNEGSQYCRDFANSIHSDLKLYDELLNNLLIIDQLEIQEHELYKKGLNKIKEISRSIDVLLDKNSGKIQSKPSIYDNSIFYRTLREKLNFLGNYLQESDIKKSIDNLKLSKDNIEIFILTTLSQILLIKEAVTSQEIYEVVKDFPKLKIRMEKFSNKTDYIYNFKLPFKEMSYISTIVDPIIANNLSISKKYLHLITLSKWILTALNIIFYMNFYQVANKYFAFCFKELELDGKILQLLNSESQDIKMIIDRKQNLDTVRKLIETISEMKKYVENIEAEKIVWSDFQRGFNEDSLNNILLTEKNDLEELYTNFSKGISKNDITSYSHQISKGHYCFCLPSQAQSYYCFNKIN